MPEYAIRNHGVAARVRPQRRGGRFVPRRPARRGFRLFGAERRRQDDVAEAAARPRRADVGQRHRARRAARQYPGPRAHRLPARALSFSRLPERARAAAFPRPLARASRARARYADRGAVAARRHGRRRTSAVAHVQQGHGAAHRSRGRVARLAGARVSRRADVGPRSARPPARARRHRRAARVRRLRVPELAPARRGRGHVRSRGVREARRRRCTK